MTTFERERVKVFQLTSFSAFRECLRSECEALCDSRCENLWIPKADIKSSNTLAIELFVAHVYNHITSPMLASEFAGVELWVQVGCKQKL